MTRHIPQVQHLVCVSFEKINLLVVKYIYILELLFLLSQFFRSQMLIAPPTLLIKSPQHIQTITRRQPQTKYCLQQSVLHKQSFLKTSVNPTTQCFMLTARTIRNKLGMQFTQIINSIQSIIPAFMVATLKSIHMILKIYATMHTCVPVRNRKNMPNRVQVLFRREYV